MRIKNFLLYSFFFLQVLSCTNKKEERYNETFLFAKADEIEILSYPNRNDWDSNGEVIDNGKVKLDQKRIVQRIMITKLQSEKLFDILYNFSCKDQEVNAACYEPRHSIIFYKKKKAFAFIEICLDCMNTHSTDGIKHFGFCAEKINAIDDLFHKVGLTKPVNDLH